MFELFGGAALTAAAVALLGHFKARGGKVHQVVALPSMETTLAIVFVALFAVGLTMLLSGLLS